MIKRLFKVLAILPVLIFLLLSFFPEIFIYSIRWIITGQEFPDEPIGVILLIKLLEL
jgi:hypothetical protein